MTDGSPLLRACDEQLRTDAEAPSAISVVRHGPLRLVARAGIHRALTAARARSALAQGKALVHSDSTEYARPILERSGLVKVSTTTPYVWSR